MINLKKIIFFLILSYRFPIKRCSKSDEKSINLLLANSYLSGKYDRKRRLYEKHLYIWRHLREVCVGGGFVLDLGPGPGEFLEISRYYKNGVIGMDAPIGKSEMGDDYLNLSCLLSKRQGVPVIYAGCSPSVAEDYNLPFPDKYFSVVNSQGSLEQIFSDCLEGVPHRIHKNAKELSWLLTSQTAVLLKKFLSEIHRVLDVGGVFLVHMNGANNLSQFNSFLDDLVDANMWSVIFRVENMVKLRKEI